MFARGGRRIGLALALTALVIGIGAASPAAAGSDFGQHVSTCSRTMGFSGQHNPGMHQGFHGWDANHEC